MRLQTIIDSNGKPNGYYISLNDWNKLKKKFKGLESYEKAETMNNELINGIHQSIEELVQVQKGKLKSSPMDNLFNELLIAFRFEKS